MDCEYSLYNTEELYHNGSIEDNKNTQGKAMSILNQVRNYIYKYKMLENTKSVIVGLSGGADSVCLIHVLWELREEFQIDIEAVHINHGIRGAEAGRDEEFAKNMCNKLEIPITVFQYDVPAYAKERGLSEEEAGRILRYDSFRKVAKKIQKSKICVAHNSNDNVETFLHHLCRGSSLEGLTAIKPVSGEIIRPIMCLSRAEIEKYLGEQQIPFITDSTNLDNDYTRNKIRNVVLPYLEKEINQHTGIHIHEAIRDITEANDFINLEIQKKYRQISSVEGERLILDRRELVGMETIIARGIVRMAICQISGKLKDITRTHIESVRKIAAGQSGKVIQLPYQIQVRTDYEKLIFQRKKDIFDVDDLKKDVVIDTLANQACVDFGEYEIKTRIFEVKKGEYEQYLKNLTKNLYTKAFDYDKIKKSVVVRTRRTGDYLTVNSEMGTKKLKRYFIDEKVSGDERDRIPLIADDSHILWVVGYRMSEYYKISENTTNVLEITISKKEFENER